MVIAGTGIRTLLRQRGFIALLLVSWVPFLVRAVQLYAATNLPQATFLSPTPKMFRQYLGQQELFLFFVTVYAGAGLVANDRRANALQIYLSKPLTRVEYIVGKLAVLLTFLLLVSFVPGMLLLMLQIMFSGSFTFFVQNLYLVPAITLFSAVEALTMASIVVALSSLSKSSRYVGVLYAACLFFAQAMYGVLYVLTRDSRLASISVLYDLAQVGDAIFRVPLSYKMPVAIAVAVLVAVIAGSLAVLDRQVRAVEIVT